MKVLGLLLLLLVAVSSTEVDRAIPNDITEYIEIVKCFLNQENLINDVTSLIDIIKSGEYDKLLSLAFKIYADGTAAVKECVKKEDVQLGRIPIQGEIFDEYQQMMKRTIECYVKFINSESQNMLECLDNKKFVQVALTKEQCEEACRKMYIGYQLLMCYSVCNQYFD